MIKHFNEITFHHIPTKENQVENALATLSSMYKVNFQNEEPVIRMNRKDEPTYCLSAKENYNDKSLFYDIKNYHEKKEYKANALIGDNRTLRMLTTNFFLDRDVLYKRNYDIFLLKYVDKHGAHILIKEIHVGSFRTHAN